MRCAAKINSLPPKGGKINLYRVVFSASVQNEAKCNFVEGIHNSFLHEKFSTNLILKQGQKATQGMAWFIWLMDSPQYSRDG